MTELLKSYKLIVYYLGVFMLMIGGIILLPILMLIFYPYEYKYAYCFIIPGIVFLLIGYLTIYFFNGVKKDNLLKNQDSLLVVLIWIMTILISSIPFMLTGKYNFTQSVFEATSGYSTTGLTVVDVSECPHIFLFYRSLMLFVGGIGLVLILTCALSDRYGLRLYNAEGHTDKLLPNLVKSARLIFSIYLGYIIIGTLAFYSFGMNLFDALNHSIACLSTGGFSTQVDSILHYHSLGIDIVTMILMILGGTNFMIHLFIFKRQFKKIMHHCEVKFLLIISIIMLPIMSFILYFNNYASMFESIEVSIFQFLSCISTTGFQNVSSINSLPHAFIISMIFLMLVGGGLGSTAGAIKQYRMVVLFKGIYYNCKERLLTNKSVTSHFIEKNGQKIELTKEEIKNNVNYVVIYVFIFLLGSFVISLFGYSLEESMFEFASSLGTVGLSVGIIGYNAHPVILWTSILGMLFGRLEIFVIFDSFSRILSDVRRKKDE